VANLHWRTKKVGTLAYPFEVGKLVAGCVGLGIPLDRVKPESDGRGSRGEEPGVRAASGWL